MLQKIENSEDMYFWEKFLDEYNLTKLNQSAQIITANL